MKGKIRTDKTINVTLEVARLEEKLESSFW